MAGRGLGSVCQTESEREENPGGGEGDGQVSFIKY